MTTIPAVEVFHKVETLAEPDVLQFSPLDPSLLVVGTYHLENSTRTGSLLLYSINPQSHSWFQLPVSRLIAVVSWFKPFIAPARFWMRIGRREILVVGLSNGCVALYKLKLAGNPRLDHIDDTRLFPDTSLALSLGMSSESTSVISTLSTGEVSILDVAQESPQQVEMWKAHDLEVWCCAWRTEETILTGGDDSLLKVWDLRHNPKTTQAASKCHNAGVTAILPVSDSLVLTGSYDNHLRLLDYRNFRQPVSSIDLEGGVWRLLPRPGSSMTSFLACCMQTGAEMVSLNVEEKALRREEIFEPQEEKRLIYGGSWQDDSVAAICSFYEKSLYICGIP